MAGDTKEITVVVPINIALIKYWGKRNEELMIPLNDSVSVTVDGLWARTYVRAEYTTDSKRSHSVSVNGKAMVAVGPNNRYERVFHMIQSLIRKRPLAEDSSGAWVFEITSETNFPVQAGLASSAAGFAAIAYALGKLFHLEDAGMARVARYGSGSACRSLYPGVVRWFSGSSPDGSDCLCKPLESSAAFLKLNLKAVILVTSVQTKFVSSTVGMQMSAETSELLRFRTAQIVPNRIARLEKAIESGDWEGFAKIVIQDSNQLHAICTDTYPALNYLNEASWHLINLVNAYNARFKGSGSLPVAYTFDAGPNCCLITTEENVAKIIPYICYHCPPSRDKGSEDKFIMGLEEEETARGLDTSGVEPLANVRKMEGAVQFLIVSGVGGGPYVQQN